MKKCQNDNCKRNQSSEYESKLCRFHHFQSLLLDSPPSFDEQFIKMLENEIDQIKKLKNSAISYAQKLTKSVNDAFQDDISKYDQLIAELRQKLRVKGKPDLSFFYYMEKNPIIINNSLHDNQVQEISDNITRFFKTLNLNPMPKKLEQCLSRNIPMPVLNYKLKKYLDIKFKTHPEIKSLKITKNDEILTGGTDGKVIIRSVDDFSYGGTLKGYKNFIRIIALSPNHNCMAVAGDDPSIAIWNSQESSNKNVNRKGKRKTPAYIFNSELNGHTDSVTSIVFYPSCEFLASYSKDNTILIWDLVELEQIRMIPDMNEINCMCNFNDQFISAGNSKEVHLISFNIRETHEVPLFLTDECITAVATQKDFVIAAGKTLFVWTQQQTELEKLVKHQYPVKKLIALYISKHQKNFIFSAGKDKFVVAWNLNEFKIESVFRHDSKITDIVLSSKHLRLYSSSKDRTIKVWDLCFFDIFGSISLEYPPLILALNHSENQLFVAHDPNIIQKYSLPTNRLSLQCISHTRKVKCVALASVNILVTAGDSNIIFWDLSTYSSYAIFDSHDGDVESIAMTPDKRFLISGGRDYNIKIWEIATRKPCGVLVGHTDKVSAIVCTNEYVFSAAGTRIIVWNLIERISVRILDLHIKEVNSLHLSSDSLTLISVGDDGQVVFWNPYEGSNVVRIHKEKKLIRFSGFSKDNSAAMFIISSKNLRICILKSQKKSDVKLKKIQKVTSNIYKFPEIYSVLYLIRSIVVPRLRQIK